MFKKLNELFKEKINKPLLYSTFVLFLIILAWVVFFKGINAFNNKQLEYIVNAIPKLNIYETFMYQFRYGFFNQWMNPSFKNNIGNIIVFIPFGLFLPLAIYGYASLIINIELIKPFFSAKNFKNLFNFN